MHMCLCICYQETSKCKCVCRFNFLFLLKCLCRYLIFHVTYLFAVSMCFEEALFNNIFHMICYFIDEFSFFGILTLGLGTKD